MSRGQMLRFTESEFDARKRTDEGFVDWNPKATRLLEAEVLPTVIEALRKHPKVAWAERVNKGFGSLVRPNQNDKPSRPMAWGYKHALDITGQMRDGRRLEVEAKRPGEKATSEQQATIDGINGANGVAFVAHGVEDVFNELAKRA